MVSGGHPQTPGEGGVYPESAFGGRRAPLHTPFFRNLLEV